MKLWKIYQDVCTGYDTYDSAVVVAATIEEACAIHPGGTEWTGAFYATWASDPQQVNAICIGEAGEDMKAGTIVVASFVGC